MRVAHVAAVDLTHRFLLMPQLRRLVKEGHEVVAVSAPGRWVSEIESEGVRHVPWPGITRAWAPAADARALRELAGMLRREGFDLVHTHTPKAGVLGRLAARWAGTPHVVNTVHGYYAMPGDPLARRAPVMAAEGLAAACSHLELFQSEEDLRWARRVGIVRPGQAVFLGNGTDLDLFHPDAVDSRDVARVRASLGIPQDALVIGTVGRVVAEKGYRELIAAAREVRRALPGSVFLAVGDAPGERDGLTRTELEDASEHVVFAGWRNDVRELLAAMDVFVLASWREGVPRSAIEAAAMGKPLVLSDIRGCREVCRDRREGLLVPPRSPGLLATAISLVASTPSLRERFGRAARARAEERFDERSVTERVLEAYDRLEGRRRPIGDRVRLRGARIADAEAMAALHAHALPGAFLTSLGEPFLRVLYRALAADRPAVAIVAEHRGRVVGFVTGVPSVGAFYRRFVLHGVAAGVAAARALRSPGALRRLRETAAYPSHTGRMPEAELLSIAVHEGWRGRGIGRRLVAAFRERLALRGVAEGKVVVGAGNAEANALYEAAGFRLLGRVEVHRGVGSAVWGFSCPS